MLARHPTLAPGARIRAGPSVPRAAQVRWEEGRKGGCGRKRRSASARYLSANHQRSLVLCGWWRLGAATSHTIGALRRGSDPRSNRCTGLRERGELPATRRAAKTHPLALPPSARRPSHPLFPVLSLPTRTSKPRTPPPPKPPCLFPPPPPPKPPVPEGKAELYVGKGRTVIDDPALYPDRTELTGGWAGGEVGLKTWAAANAPSAKEGTPAPAEKTPPPTGAKPATPGGAGIYIGRGLVIQDDPAKYADKESLGPLSNVTGGFAGGERGVQAFAATGRVEIAPPGTVRQFSPLAFAVLVAAVGTGGGLLLNSGVVEVEELAAGRGGADTAAASLASSAAALAAVDGGTRTLLISGIGLAAVAAGVAGVRSAVKGAQARAASAAAGAADAVKAAAFWVAVFLAAKLVIENS